jgi:hypothetical protein
MSLAEAEGLEPPMRKHYLFSKQAPYPSWIASIFSEDVEIESTTLTSHGFQDRLAYQCRILHLLIISYFCNS